MARPRKEGLDYFPHDVHAASDPEKLEPLLLLYGAKGYAFYFLHLEYIYQSPKFEFDISDPEVRQAICQKLKITLDEYEQILQTCLKKKLYCAMRYKKVGKITSNGIKKRAKVVVEKRKKMREIYNSGNVSESETREETESEMPQSKGKESKLKENNKTAASFNNGDYGNRAGLTNSGKSAADKFESSLYWRELRQYKANREDYDEPMQLVEGIARKALTKAIESNGNWIAETYKADPAKLPREELIKRIKIAYPYPDCPPGHENFLPAIGQVVCVQLAKWLEERSPP